jgi:hypothetical protein
VRIHGAARHSRDEARVERRCLVVEQPDVDRTPAARKALRTDACAGLGSRIAATTRAMPRGEHGVDARRRAAVAVARLERHVQRRAATSRPRARASASAATSACAAAARSWKPSPSDSPSRRSRSRRADSGVVV